MKLEVILTGQDEMRAATEFMARLTAIRYPSFLDDTPTEKAAKAIEKAKKTKPAPVEEVVVEAVAAVAEPAAPAPAPVAAEAQAAAEPVPTINVADLQALASAKSKTAGAVKVRETIASFGAENIRTSAPEQLPKIKAALEAL